MPTRDLRDHFEDILDSSEAIEEFLSGVTLAAYMADRKTRSAVERELQKLTEAVFRLGENAARLCPEIDWRKIRGLGNFLRHEYHKVDDQTIWDTIHQQIPLVQIACRNALNEPEVSGQGSA